MATLTQSTSFPSRTAAVTGWLVRAQGWLDARGRGAWIAAMVLGFIFFWPAGLALLAYMIWSNRMFSSSSRSCARTSGRHSQMDRPTGNAAFDAYKSDTLRRLEEEQDSFESFLERLRAAKDKSEFDAFMNERSTRKDDAAKG
jgi:predicted CopG family antitoxin